MGSSSELVVGPGGPVKGVGGGGGRWKEAPFLQACKLAGMEAHLPGLLEAELGDVSLPDPPFVLCSLPPPPAPW